MDRMKETRREESEKLIRDTESSSAETFPRDSLDSVSSASTTSLILENLNAIPLVDQKPKRPPVIYRDNESDPELPQYDQPSTKITPMSKTLRRMVWIVSIAAVAGWSLAIVLFFVNGRHVHSSALPYDHEAPMKSAGKQVTLESVQKGEWRPQSASVSWTSGANGEDGLILTVSGPGKDHLVVEDVRHRNSGDKSTSKTLVKSGYFNFENQDYWTDSAVPSQDLKWVLLRTRTEKNFRHSFTGLYFLLNVETQAVQPLDPDRPLDRIQLAQWSPTNDYISFTRDNNLFLRKVRGNTARQVTLDGGVNLFYGIPDWVYEEEVFENNIGSWFSNDGGHIAFIRTNETEVPDYPVQYFVSRPSGKQPEPGLESYPEIRQIKYPKAGAPNPVVDLLFHDISKGHTYNVEIDGGFEAEDRIISSVIWVGSDKAIVHQVNRESDHLQVLLIDSGSRTGKIVRQVDFKKLDGGWYEPGNRPVHIPSDKENGRPEEGYIDMVVHNNYNHLAYFSPIDNPEPVMLTSGEWEVEDAPSAVDLKNNLLYFVATKESSTQRHIYSVDLQGKNLQALVPTDKPGYYRASFSAEAGYAIISYWGPGIPHQKLISTPANPEKYEEVLEENKELAKKAAAHELPHQIFSTVKVDDVELNVLERRPPHFDEKKQYPVLFYLYGGPNSQMVSRRFNVDFESYIASALGYIVVTVDGRGTGFIGRKARTIIREHVGLYEAHDQIETAKIWASKPYVDASRMAIWGWSYGGFMTLKVLETDAGRTFKYGMSVAPVTDWRFYDSIYTERYMRTPQHNPHGYAESAIHNVTALSQNVRWLMMHGIADDNVHMQNTLTLIDKLDLNGIDNYDVHVFPDSDHSIYFHNANTIVYDKLSKWLVNAFNGEWYKTEDPKPEWKSEWKEPEKKPPST